MSLAYSLFLYLFYVAPTYGIIFHLSIEEAPDPERDPIYEARESLERTAGLNSADMEMDDDVYTTHTAIDMFDTAEKQEIGLSKFL